MSRFHPADRKTPYLLPPSLEDWLPEDHLARFVAEALERIDLSHLRNAYAGLRLPLTHDLGRLITHWFFK